MRKGTKSHRIQQLSKYWDFVTLSKFRWYLLLGWIIGWFTPRVISFDYWTIFDYEGMSPYFVLQHWAIFSDVFWANYPRYLLGAWATGISYWIGFGLIIVVMFLFLVEILREAQAKERQYFDLVGKEGR